MTSGLKSINHEQRLYVLHEGQGYSCLGFEVAHKRAQAVAGWADLPAPVQPLGTEAAYLEYETIMMEGMAYAMVSGRRCNAELTEQLMGLENRRVEVVDRYGEKRRFWVGVSTGWIPCHLEIARRNCHGGYPVTGAPFESVKIIR